MVTRTAKLRRLWLDVHLWIGVGLALLLIPISISGGLLVYHDEIDALITPHRYAITGPQVALPPSAYIAKAAEAVAKDPADLRPTGLRYPDGGGPVRVVTRAHKQEGGGRPRFVTVFLDPPTAAVLDVMEFRTSFIGFLHVFHENLTIPQYSGRQIVGWAGVGMLILSLTGIWLWWPRHGSFLRAMRWTRSPRFTFNLHNMLGFWIAIPLAAVSLTGIYLSFPQTARSVMSSVAPMSPQGQRGGFNAAVATQTAMTPDRAVELAQAAEPNGKPLAVFLPTAPQQRSAQQARASQGEQPANTARGENAGGRSGGPVPSWRVQLTRADSEQTVTVMVDDRSGKTSMLAPPQSGDRAASWIRWIHEGSHTGPVWQTIVFLTGVFPAIFAITGVIMWLRQRTGRKALERMRASTSVDAQLRPAE